MATMSTELPPTYNEAVAGFIPPPEYQNSIDQSHLSHGATPATSSSTTAASSTPIPTNSMAREEYYQSKKLNLVVLDDFNEDPRDVEMLNIPNDQYISKSDDELQDLYHSIYTIVEDKFIQVKRNTEFVHKKVRSMYDHYYINQLRNNTIEDFIKIKSKLEKELSSLPQIFQYYKEFNHLYESVTNEINALKFELENSIDPEHITSSEGELLAKSSLLTTKSNMLKKIRFNLAQIDEKIKDLSDTEEVSYVLKERARIYNLATDFVKNQSSV